MAANIDYARVPPPLIGALLRVAHDAVRLRVLAEVNQAGFELSGAEFAVFQYPGPEGLRPIDLAIRGNTSKQAINYLLAGLQERGYVERRPAPGRRANAVYVTGRGRALALQMRASVTKLEREWTALVGAERFDELRVTLCEIALQLGEMVPSAPAAAR